LSVTAGALGLDLTYRTGVVNIIDDSGDILLVKNLDDHLLRVMSAIVRS